MWGAAPASEARVARLLRKLPLLGKLFAKPTRTYQTERTSSGDFSVADAASYIAATDTS